MILGGAIASAAGASPSGAPACCIDVLKGSMDPAQVFTDGTAQISNTIEKIGAAGFKNDTEKISTDTPRDNTEQICMARSEFNDLYSMLKTRFLLANNSSGLRLVADGDASGGYSAIDSAIGNHAECELLQVTGQCTASVQCSHLLENSLDMPESFPVSGRSQCSVFESEVELESELSLHVLPVMASDVSRHVFVCESVSVSEVSSSGEDVEVEPEAAEKEKEKEKENHLWALMTAVQSSHSLADSVLEQGQQSVLLQQQVKQLQQQLEQQQLQYLELRSRVEVSEWYVLQSDVGILPKVDSNCMSNSASQSVSQTDSSGHLHKSRKQRKLDRIAAEQADQAALDSFFSDSPSSAAVLQDPGSSTTLDSIPNYE